MKHVVSFPLFLLCVTCFGLSVAIAVYAWYEPTRISPPPPSSSLVAKPPVIDFGSIREGKVSGTSALTNVSKKPLRILHVFVSCSCSDVCLKEGIVPPGGSVELSVTWNTHGRLGKTKTSLSVIYFFDEIEQYQQSLTVELRADVDGSTESSRSAG